MIDSNARKIAAEVAQRFVAGQILKFEFESNFPVSEDPAMKAIKDTLWRFYDDLEGQPEAGSVFPQPMYVHDVRVHQ